MRAKPFAVAVGALAAVLVSGVLGACSHAPAAPKVPPAQRLADARTRLEQSPAVGLTLDSADLPGGASGVMGATGTGLFSPPSFAGTLTAKVGGISGKIAVIAVSQDVYIKLFTPTYAKVDPKTYGAPNPAQLFDPAHGVTSLIGRTTQLAQGGQVRDGSDVLSSYTGRLPGSAIADLLVIGDRNGTFTVTYGVSDSTGDLRTVVLRGPFYAGSTSTYTLHLRRLPNPVAITRP